MPPPARMSLFNVDDATYVEAQFNPKEVRLALEAFFNRVRTPGQSYEDLQYAATGNPKYSFTLAFDGMARSSAGLLSVEAFLLALQYPKRVVGSVRAGAPPEVLFSWPNWIALTTFLPKITQTTTRWDSSGIPTYQTYQIELEARFTRRIGREDIRRSAMRVAA